MPCILHFSAMIYGNFRSRRAQSMLTCRVLGRWSRMLRRLCCLCRPSDYADLVQRTRIGGGERASEVGIILSTCAMLPTPQLRRRRHHVSSITGPDVHLSRPLCRVGEAGGDGTTLAARLFASRRAVIPTPLAAAVPSVASFRRTGLPRALEPGEVHRLLAACDRRTRIGRRDFAILRLLVRLGLRAGEVRTPPPAFLRRRRGRRGDRRFAGGPWPGERPSAASRRISGLTQWLAFRQIGDKVSIVNVN